MKIRELRDDKAARRCVMVASEKLCQLPERAMMMTKSITQGGGPN